MQPSDTLDVSKQLGLRVLLLGTCLGLAGACGCTAPALKSLGGIWPQESSGTDAQIRQAALKDPFPNAGPRGY